MLGARVALGQRAIGQFEPPAGVYTIAADAGSYTISGQAATLRSSRNLIAAAGSYSISGQAATLSRDRRLSCATGSYTISGQTATLRAIRYMVASPNTRETATIYSYFLFAALGQVSLGGSLSQSIAAPVTTYSIQGFDAILRRGISLTAAAGSYTLTGQNAGQRFTRAVIAASGAYVLSGKAAALAVSMPAAAGSYTLTGQAVTFARIRKRIRGFARVGSSITARAA